MKSLKFTLISLLFVIASCDKENPSSAEETIRGLLTAGIWEIESVEIDDVDHTDLFAGLTLKLFDDHYESTNGNYAWSITDTWEFADDNFDTVIRGDGIEVEILHVSAQHLDLKLNWDVTSYVIGGRAKSLEGEHVFFFRKKK